MKTLTMHFTVAVVALAAAAASASAQTYTADVPMAFRAGSTLMAPGAYEFILNSASANQTLRVRSQDGKESVILLSISHSDPPKAWKTSETPKIGFACAGRNCSLTKLWDGRDDTTYDFRAVKLPSAEAERASITLTLVRTD
jgi:hypothetical protein